MRQRLRARSGRRATGLGMNREPRLSSCGRGQARTCLCPVARRICRLLFHVSGVGLLEPRMLAPPSLAALYATLVESVKGGV